MPVKSIIINLYLPLSRSLKSKRSIIKSIIQKVHNKYNVSISEINNNDKWKNATLGISIIANEMPYIEKQLSAIINFIENNYINIEITKIEDYY
ncbi:MAG: DUF503 domain-containing protein [Candidatus Cloacimonetes bacterium]|nr:DUF503 domain-containing protein [Candidatus Cloacimonadota bacterium]